MRPVGTGLWTTDYSASGVLLLDIQCSTTMQPTPSPSDAPTVTPTSQPSQDPTPWSSGRPSLTPTHSPSEEPSLAPTGSPTNSPTGHCVAALVTGDNPSDLDGRWDLQPSPRHGAAWWKQRGSDLHYYWLPLSETRRRRLFWHFSQDRLDPTKKPTKEPTKDQCFG